MSRHYLDALHNKIYTDCVFIDLESAQQSPEGRTVLVHVRRGVPEKYIRLVKDMYHQCETVVRCAAGTSEPFAVEVGLHQGSAFSTLFVNYCVLLCVASHYKIFFCIEFPLLVLSVHRCDLLVYII